MSPELLILFIVLVVVMPLIEQVLKALRQRDAPGRPETQTEDRMEDRIEEQPPQEKPPAPALHLATAVPAPPKPPAEPRRKVVLAGLRNRADLRRSIVLITILGPCRAIPVQGTTNPTGQETPRHKDAKTTKKGPN